MFSGIFARRIVGLGPASLYLEVPVAGGPRRDVQTSFTNVPILSGVTATLSQSTFFFTPSAKVKFLDSARLSPFATLGGGLALSHVSVPGVPSGVPGLPSRNTGALQFGGGLDFKSPVPHLGFLAEARDFYAGTGGQSSSVTTVSPTRLHHVFVGGGAVLKF